MLAVLQVTERCNYTFSFCYVAPTRPSGRIRASGYEDLLDELSRLGVTSVAISGGEPLLVENLCDVVEALRARAFAVGLLSNGSRPQSDVLTKVDMAQISIDGPPQVHDAVRGRRGAFARAVATVRRLQGVGVPVGIQVTCTEETGSYLQETLRLIMGLAVQQVRVVVVDKTPGGCEEQEWFRPLYEDLLDVSYGSPMQTDVTCNLVEERFARAVIGARLETSPLPLYVSLNSRSVAIGFPELSLWQIGDERLEDRVLSAQRRVRDSFRAMASPARPGSGVVSLDTVLSNEIKRLSRSSDFCSRHQEGRR